MKTEYWRFWLSGLYLFTLFIALSGVALAQDADAVRYVYDDLGRLIKVIDDSGQVAEYVYDPLGNILEIRRGTLEPLAIFNFTPSRGSARDIVQIEGQGFAATPGDNALFFGGAPATVTTASPTQLIAVVPDPAATGPITVEVAGSSAVSDSSFIVLPSITGIDPTYILAGETIDSLQVAGFLLDGSGFVFTPDTTTGLSVTSAMTDPAGQAATLTVTADPGALGYFTLTASIPEGSSSSASSGANTLRALDPEADDDNDGLGNAEEVALGTHPLNPDSDGDGFSDGDEVNVGSDPGNSNSLPLTNTASTVSVFNNSDPALYAGRVTAVRESVLNTVDPGVALGAVITSPLSTLNQAEPNAIAGKIIAPVVGVENIAGQ